MSIQDIQPLSDCGSVPKKTAASTLSNHEIYGLLSNKRRIYFLEGLFARGGKAEFNDLVDDVVEREMSITPQHPNWSDKRKTVRVSLYQSHIKRLSDNKIVEYKTKTGTMRLGENAEQVREYLDVDIPQSTDQSGWMERLLDLFHAVCE